jgi:hypothetical protein
MMQQEKIVTIEPEQDVETFKAYCDYAKHLATLATGSVLVIVTFLTRTNSPPKLRGFAIIALIAFVSTLMSTARAYSLLIQVRSGIYKARQAKVYKILGGTLGFIEFLSKLGFAWAMFVVGIIALTVFAIGNMF